MTDTHAGYGSNALPQTLQAFKNRPCAMPFTNDSYVPPEPEEVAQLIHLAGWSQNTAAKIVGVKWSTDKGSSTIRKWKSDKAKKDHREIPYSAWRLMLLYAGVVVVDEEVKKNLD